MNTGWDLIQFDKPIQILQQQQLNLYSNPTHVSLSLDNWWFKSINSTKTNSTKKTTTTTTAATATTATTTATTTAMSY